MSSEVENIPPLKSPARRPHLRPLSSHLSPLRPSSLSNTKGEFVPQSRNSPFRSKSSLVKESTKPSKSKYSFDDNNGMAAPEQKESMPEIHVQVPIEVPVSPLPESRPPLIMDMNRQQEGYSDVVFSPNSDHSSDNDEDMLDVDVESKSFPNLILGNYTVFLATKKETVNKINYLYILSSPLVNKFYTDRKKNIKTFHTIKERVNFLM